MTSPTHAIVNLLALGKGRPHREWLAVTLGALLPDLPMFVFYLIERLVLGTPEAVIWQTAYYESRWQDFFDVFNSLPLAAVMGGLAYFWG